MILLNAKPRISVEDCDPRPGLKICHQGEFDRTSTCTHLRGDDAGEVWASIDEWVRIVHLLFKKSG